MEKLKFEVGDIATIKLCNEEDSFDVGTEVEVIDVDHKSEYLVYKVEVTSNRYSYWCSYDWVSADHLEKLNKLEVGNTISYQELVEAIISEEFEIGYLIEYMRHVGRPIVMVFNGHSFVGKNSSQTLCLNKSSATSGFKLLGVEEVSHTYRLPDSVAKAIEIGTCDAYLRYFKHEGIYCFHNAVNGGEFQINFTNAEFAKIPDMDGLKDLLIKGEAK